jgi:predicted RNase H-like HicB family nuclease
MKSVKYVHWQEGDWWLGYLEEYPDYWTQGETLPDLIEHLKDLTSICLAAIFLVRARSASL